MADVYTAARDIAQKLIPGSDYTVDQRHREVELRTPGRQKIDAECGNLPALWRSAARRAELVQQALTAREFFLKEKQYVILDGKVVIVDEFTGRMMPQRTWSYGLHQAIEAKEGIEISPPSETLARLSFQRFFRFFRKLAGMTGTAREAADEFWHVYHLPVITIPTHRPCVRRMLPDRVFADPETKWDAVVQDISRIHTQGRPILVGTRSIEASEHLARCLAREGLAFQLLNAVHHREEAQIVAQAGQAGQITIATNMAGRGTDILLGPGVVAMGGLHVIATERHESGRIDRQLFGRGARQGDPGSAQAFLSLDDELFRRFLPQTLRGRVRHAVAHRLPGASLLARQAAALSQYVAQRQAYRQRCAVLRMDTWLDDALSFTSASSSA
jgi:preprotein translocase subunit SecA